jgi:hypothetical protein
MHSSRLTADSSLDNKHMKVLSKKNIWMNVQFFFSSWGVVFSFIIAWAVIFAWGWPRSKKLLFIVIYYCSLNLSHVWKLNCYILICANVPQNVLWTKSLNPFWNSTVDLSRCIQLILSHDILVLQYNTILQRIMFCNNQKQPVTCTCKRSKYQLSIKL